VLACGQHKFSGKTGVGAGHLARWRVWQPGGQPVRRDPSGDLLVPGVRKRDRKTPAAQLWEANPPRQGVGLAE